MDIASEKDENVVVKEVAQKLETIFLNADDTSILKATMDMDESFVTGSPKNPLLLSPVIRCVLKFMNFEEIKNFRFVCREWGSTGKLALASRALISLDNHKKSSRICRLADFQSCFLESAAVFSSFKISVDFTEKHTRRDPCTIGELTKFFHKQQKYIKELSLNFEFSDEKIVEKIDLGSWLSESPMVKKDTKHMTKLWIERHRKMLDIPLHLIMHIKDLSLSNCRISLETGIKICPIKLNLSEATFYRNGIKVDRVLLNDIIDFSKAKEVNFSNFINTEGIATVYDVDLRGNVNLEKLSLSEVKIVNGETSRWAIDVLRMYAPYSLNSQMKIKELTFPLRKSDIMDVSTLPISIRKLTLYDDGSLSNTIICSKPLVLENLQHLTICMTPNFQDETGPDFSFLSHFVNCPQLTSLSLLGCEEIEMNTLWMPKSLKVLSLGSSIIKWRGDSNWNLETLIIDWSFHEDNFKWKIQVGDVVMIWDKTLDKYLVDLLEDRKRFSFGNRLFIGELKWGEEELEDSALNGHVDTKSSF